MDTDDHDLGELSCNVFALEKVEAEDDSCGMFSIQVHASFMPPINESEYEEDESMLYDLECDILQKTFVVERQKLLCQETSSETITEILVSMNVPLESFIIDKILDCARQTESDKGYHLEVQIDVPPSSRFREATAMDDDGNDNDNDNDFDTDDDNDFDIDDDYYEFEARLVPATKASVEALEKIRVEDSTNCAICLEGVLTGSEATRMSCLHVFHSHCILNWLEKCGTCPLCRNQIS